MNIMSYFGTSGPRSDFNRSIGAGYVRRLNLDAQRNTRGIGSIGQAPLKLSTFNTRKAIDNTIATRGVNIRDRLNNWYNSKTPDQYGDVNQLLAKVRAWENHASKVVMVKLQQKQVAEARHAAFALDVDEMYKLNDRVKEQFQLITDGRSQEANDNIVTESIKEAAKLDNKYKDSTLDTYIPGYSNIFGKYTGLNFKSVEISMLEYAGGKFDADGNVLKAGLLQKRSVARKEHTNATEVLDRVYVKDVEDWMVSGPLMRESKTALVISPLMLSIGVLGGVYLMDKFAKRGPRKATGNKSAAYAVFS